jgi:hypothetical protein
MQFSDSQHRLSCSIHFGVTLRQTDQNSGLYWFLQVSVRTASGSLFAQPVVGVAGNQNYGRSRELRIPFDT